jgi:DHA2 family multidrug resistance protein
VTDIAASAVVMAASSERIAPRRLVAFLIMVFGMFMSILDIQVVSASLSDIQAGLSASSTEVSWVQTSYLIAEVIAIPLSGFLSRAFGTRLLFAISAAGFTVASFLCGLASSIEQMILWRAIQGFLGAGMIPTVFASAYTVFPRSKFYIVGPIIGLVATLAPTIGPTVGGLITDLMSWHWLFFINIVPGIIITAGVLALVDFDQPNFALLDRFDWFGLIAMAGFLGSLEYVLEEGPQYEWLQDSSVAVFAWISGISAIAFFYRVLTAEEPIVDIRAFGDRNFGVGGWKADAKIRSAPDHCRRSRDLCDRRLPDDVDHARIRFLRTFGAADPARHRHDVRDGAHQQHRIRHAAAACGQKRLGSVQPDAQSGRRGGTGAYQPGTQRAHRPAHFAPAGPRQLGQCVRD